MHTWRHYDIPRRISRLNFQHENGNEESVLFKKILRSHNFSRVKTDEKIATIHKFLSLYFNMEIIKTPKFHWYFGGEIIVRLTADADVDDEKASSFSSQSLLVSIPAWKKRLILPSDPEKYSTWNWSTQTYSRNVLTVFLTMGTAALIS